MNTARKIEPKNPFGNKNIIEESLRDLQLDLFQSTPEDKGWIKLSPAYELLPKEVNNDSPDIKKTISECGSVFASPYKIVFSEKPGQPRKQMVISPAQIEDKYGNTHSRFPALRESRVEHALIIIASKFANKLETKYKSNMQVLRFETSIYQIRREIVNAQAQKYGWSETDRSNIEKCPYSNIQVQEALEVLKATNYKVITLDGKSVDSFSRLGNYGRRNENLFIEMGTIQTKAILSGQWQITNATELIATRSLYMLRLVRYLLIRFTFATHGKPFNITYTNLREYLRYPSTMSDCKVRHAIKTLIQGCDLISGYQIENVKKDGRRIVEQTYYLYPSQNFVGNMVIANAKNKLKRNQQGIEHGVTAAYNG